MPTAQKGAALGSLWTVATPSAGVTVTANYVVSVASANTLGGILMPTGNVAGYVTRVVVLVVTGTMVTGGFVWGVMPATQAAVITSTGFAATNNFTMLTGGHLAKSFAGDGANGVLTGSTGMRFLRPFGGGVAGAVTAGTPYTLEEDDTDDLVVAPGCFLGLFAAVASTTLVAVASLTWSEKG